MMQDEEAGNLRYSPAGHEDRIWASLMYLNDADLTDAPMVNKLEQG